VVIIVALALSVLIVVLSAWTGGGSRPQTTTSTNPQLVTGVPEPLILARVGSLDIRLPIALGNITAIAYHAAQDTVALSPEGKQANEGLLARLVNRFTGSAKGAVSYYELSGGVGTSNGALDVGAPTGADVYAPVDGTVVQIGKYIVNGRTFGSRIDIRPDDDPSVIVSVTRLVRDHGLKIGQPLVADATRLGIVVDLSQVEHQTLAAYSHDPGNHVTIEVTSAAIPVLP
jgi:hypothetical protein